MKYGATGSGGLRRCKLRTTSFTHCTCGTGQSRCCRSSRSATTDPSALRFGRAPGTSVIPTLLVSAPHSRSMRNVSSVAGSVRTMSGSFSMCSPSRVKGSILSSSRGNWESASKPTSPTPAKELVSSFDKLGGDSPVTAGRERGGRTQQSRICQQTRQGAACKNSGIIH